MNLPNKLTMARLGLTLLFLVVILWPSRFHETVALALFVAASVTDLLDGRLARRYNIITNFGILMDPLADKILICSAFIAFVGLQLIPAWMAVVVVARELAITGLRLLAATKNVVLAAEGYGKHKTVSQIVAVISILIFLSYPTWGSWGRKAFEGWVPTFAHLALWVAVILTFFSGACYLWHNRHLYLREI